MTPGDGEVGSLPLEDVPRLPDDARDRLQELLAAVSDLEAHLEGLETAPLDKVAGAIQVCEVATQAARNMADSIRDAAVGAVHDFERLIEDKLMPAIAAATTAAKESTQTVVQMAVTLEPLDDQIDIAATDLTQEVQNRAVQLTSAGSDIHDLTRQLFDEVGGELDAVTGVTIEAEESAGKLASRIDEELVHHASEIVDAALEQFVQPMQGLLQDFREELGRIETQLRQVIGSCGDSFATHITQFVDAQLAGVYAEIDSTVAKLEQRLGLESSGQSNAADGSRSSSDMLDGVFRETIGKLPIVKEIGGIVGMSI